METAVLFEDRVRFGNFNVNLCASERRGHGLKLAPGSRPITGSREQQGLDLHPALFEAPATGSLPGKTHT
jgi:hypothetical protein